MGDEDYVPPEWVAEHRSEMRAARWRTRMGGLARQRAALRGTQGGHHDQDDAGAEVHGSAPAAGPRRGDGCSGDVGAPGTGPGAPAPDLGGPPVPAPDPPGTVRPRGGASGTPVWYGAFDRAAYSDDVVDLGDDLADNARDGVWCRVSSLVMDHPELVNRWRFGGRSFLAPLHRAASQGAGSAVVRWLIDHGAWTTLPDVFGSTPADLARLCGDEVVAEAIDQRTPTLPGGTSPEDAAVLTARLHQLVLARTAVIPPDVRGRLRALPVPVLLEAGGSMWYPVPGMYGGFSVRWDDGRLDVTSWSRVVGGSGQRHLVTPAGTELVESGFV